MIKNIMKREQDEEHVREIVEASIGAATL